MRTIFSSIFLREINFKPRKNSKNYYCRAVPAGKPSFPWMQKDKKRLWRVCLLILRKQSAQIFFNTEKNLALKSSESIEKSGPAALSTSKKFSMTGRTKPNCRQMVIDIPAMFGGLKIFTGGRQGFNQHSHRDSGNQEDKHTNRFSRLVH